MGRKREIDKIDTDEELQAITQGLKRIVRERTARLEKASRALRESEEKLRAMFESVSDGISIVDLEGKVVEANQAHLRMFGYSRKEELIGKSALDGVAQKDQARVIEEMANLAEASGELGEYRLQDKDGREFDAELASAVLSDSSGNQTGVITVIRDITERKQAEEALRASEEKLRLAFESIGDAILVVDLEANIVEANEAALRMFGYSKEELIGQKGFDIVSPKDSASAIETMAKSFETGRGPEKLEYTFLAADGREVEGEFSAAVLHDSSGNPMGIIAVVRDTTERKRAEEALQTSEERYRHLVESINDGYVVIDIQQARIVFANDKVAGILGYQTEELVGAEYYKLMSPDPIADHRELRRTIARGGAVPERYEAQGLRKDGNKVSLEVSMKTIDYEGRPAASVVVRDITERKRMEEELIRLSNAVRMATDSIVISDLEANIIDVNEATLRMYGTDDKADLIGRNSLDLIAPEDREKALAGVKEVLERGYNENVEYPIITKDGSRILVEMSSAIMKGMDGKPTGFVGVSRDITERKQMEEALRQQTHNLSERVKELRCLYGVAELIEKKDIPPEEIAQGTVGLIPPAWQYPEITCARITLDSQEFRTENFKETKWKQTQDITVHGDRFGTLEVCYLEERPEIDEGPFLREERNLISAIAMQLGEVIERKRAAEALRESEERLRAFIENAPDGIYINDLMGNFVDGNRKAEELVGYSREELIGKNFVEAGLLPEEYIPAALAGLEQNIRGEASGPDEFELIRKDGSRVLLEIRTFPIARKGKVEVLGIARDITERKRAEEALRESEEKLRATFETMSDAIAVTNIFGNFVDVNEAMVRLHGYSHKEELIGRNALDVIAEKDRSRVMEDIGKALGEGGTALAEYAVLTKDGGEVEVEANSAQLRDSSGNPVGIIAAVRDITERKRAEEVLLESEEKYRSLVDDMNEGYMVQQGRRVVFANKRCAEYTGIPLENLAGTPVVDLLPPESLEQARELNRSMRDGKWPEQVEMALKKGDGSTYPGEIRFKEVTWEGKPAISLLIRDVTERKQMEQALGESEQKYRALFDSGLEGVFVIDAETMKVVLANQTAARMYGFDSAEDAIGGNPLDFVHPDDRERALNSIVEDMFEKDLRQVNEFRTITKDGKQKWISALGTTIEYQGKLAGLVSISDVTERKRAEEALRESEERYRTILEDIEDGYFEVDIAGNFTFFNDPMCGIIGYSRDEMMGMNNRQYMDKQNAKKVYQAFNRVFTTGIPSKEFGWETIRKNGVKRFIEASVSLTKNSEGEPNGFRGIVTDITERKRAEEEIRQKSVELERKNLVLEETTQHLNTLQAITGVGLSPMGLDEMLQEMLSHFVQGVGTSFGVIWLLDEERGELRARASLQPEVMELSAEDFTLDIKQPSFGMLLTLTTPLLLEGKDVLGIPMSDKLRKALKDAQVKSVMLVPLTYQGKVIGIACCGWRERREFTPRERGLLQIIAERAATAIEFHRLNEETRQKSVEVEQKNLELMRVNELKSEFLANMSHELRTPMNAIMGYTSLMLRERYGTLTEKQTEALWRVDRNTKNLLSLINNILDLSKIEAGKMPLYNEEVDLRELLEEVIATVEPMVREAKLALETAVAQDIPALWTDRSKLKQTILNLLSNAVKFTPEGGITVSAWSSDGHVKVAVKDTGIGIREEELKVIFDEFRQLDGSTTRDKGGTGLGLAIARKFANLLGGDIEVESVYGQGSTFTITIPCSSPPQPPKHIPEPIAEVPARQGTAAKTILAIDDDPEIVALLRENLADTDYEVVGTLSGEEGIKVAAELQPFAITLDILMPHRDGWYVIHKLKNDPKTAHIPVIIISIIEEKHLAYSLGVTDYIVKPIERDLLITKLKRLERVGQREAVVVDDDPEVVSLLRDILQGEGYIVRAALSGSDAISQIEAKPPDYLFLDIEMSEMNGFNVLNHVWSKPYGKEMVIVLTSARDLTAEERDFLSKRANIMIGKTDLHKKEAVEKLKLALAAAQVKKGVPGGNEAEDSGGRRQRG